MNKIGNPINYHMYQSARRDIVLEESEVMPNKDAILDIEFVRLLLLHTPPSIIPIFECTHTRILHFDQFLQNVYHLLHP